MQHQSHLKWTCFLRRAMRSGNLRTEAEFELWRAAVRYAECPSKDRERELRRVAKAFGIEPPPID